MANKEKPIPGLDITPEERHRIWSIFSGWSDHFLRRLETAGVSALLEDYKAIVATVQPPDFDRDTDEVLKDAKSWLCCDDRYEYQNDISLRTAIQKIMDLLPPEKVAALSSAISQLDDRLFRLYPPGTIRDGSWWETALPSTIPD